MILELRVRCPGLPPVRRRLLAPLAAGCGDALDLPDLPAGTLHLAPSSAGCVAEAACDGIQAAGRPLPAGTRRLVRPGESIVARSAVIEVAAATPPVGGGETRAAAGALLAGWAPLGPALLVVDGPEAGRRIALDGTKTIGRGRAADVRLADRSASRVHLRVEATDGTVEVIDLRSKNGLRVNGRRRTARRLAPGDRVAAGETEMIFEEGCAAASAGAPAAEGAPGGDLPPAPPREADEPGSRGRLARPGWRAAGAAALLALAAALLALP